MSVVDDPTQRRGNQCNITPALVIGGNYLLCRPRGQLQRIPTLQPFGPLLLNQLKQTLRQSIAVADMLQDIGDRLSLLLFHHISKVVTGDLKTDAIMNSKDLRSTTAAILFTLFTAQRLFNGLVPVGGHSREVSCRDT